MLVRNFLKAGCYATVVPVGVPLTIRYNDRGMIDQVAQGYVQAETGDDKLLTKFIEDNVVSRTVPSEGTTWVQGILFTHDMINDTALVGHTIADRLLDKFLHDSSGFEFFAGNLVSTAREYPNATAVTQWLGLAKFKSLPGFIIPSNLTADKLDAVINLPGYAFDYPLVDGFWIWENANRSYCSNDLHALDVISVDEVLEPNSGKSLVSLKLANGSECSVDYYEAKKFDIHAGDCLLEDCTGTLLYNFMRPQYSGAVYYTCPTCGHQHVLAPTAVAMCDNPHCTSTLYPQVAKFLLTLGFDAVTQPEYQSIVDKCGKVFMLPDILELDKFENVVKDCTLMQVLNATIPSKYVSDSSKLFGTLLQDCNNSDRTMMYYLQHFDRFLQSSSYELDCNIQSWLNDPRNLLELQAVLDNPHIRIIGEGKKFDGAPIFRNKTIIVTGRFLHGTFDEIKSIFASYSADTINIFSSTADCLVIGDMQEDINGSIINQCRKINMPIFNEQEFFDKYEIDSDLSENL
jgi:hypothetical protein